MEIIINNNDILVAKYKSLSLMLFLTLIEVGNTNIIVSMRSRVVEMRFTLWGHPFSTHRFFQFSYVCRYKSVRTWGGRSS